MTLPRDLDRSDIAPSHRGHHVLPNDPLFSRLLRHARRDRLAIIDCSLDVKKTYGELLDAVLSFRAALWSALPKEAQRRLDVGQEVFIGVLAAGGFEFIVAVLAVLGLGAAIVPLFPGAPLEELTYYVNKSQQVAVVSNSASAGLSRRLGASCDVPHISTSSHVLQKVRFRPLEISISSNPPQDPCAPGCVIFTSGTTGKPKGVVLRRMYYHETALAIGDGFEVSQDDLLLHVLPVHHTTGLGTSIFPFLNAGACIEFHGKYDTDAVLGRWIQGGLTVFSAVPTIYMRLKWAVEQASPETQLVYKQAARKIRAFLCGSSALQENLQDFWTALRGRPILTRYGATEIPGCLRVPINCEGLPKGSVGLPVPGVELKLSPEGELLVKSPHMFARYLTDPEATEHAHDDQGWYQTGDIAKRDGDFYFILGRASVDIIKSGGYKISALDVERACLALPYVTEAMVVGVEDEEFGQRVGAVLAVKAEADLNLSDLRTDLKSKVAGYKLPTILRVVRGELPKGVTGKVQKKILGPRLIPCPGYRSIPDVQVWDKRAAQPVRDVQARL